MPIDLTYPYTPPDRRQDVRGPIGAQDTRRIQSNSQIPTQDGRYTHDNLGVVIVPSTFQDSRRVGQADKAIVGVGDPGYLINRLYSSPVLAGNEAEK